MNYKYPPIYKYGLLLITIYMFVKHQKIMSPDKILLNSVLITLFVFIFDNIIIKEHPNLLENIKEQKYKEDSEDNSDFFENELSDDEINEIINSYDTDIDSKKPRQININMRRENSPNYFDSDMILY